MDILMLVDRLEAVINGGTRVPMTDRVLIDEREALDVLDLMRTTIPEEIKQARRVNQDQQKIMAQAQTEANRVIAQAQERAERLLAQDSIRQEAEVRAREILEQARRDGTEVREGADQYAIEVLSRLDDELRHMTGSVRNAISALSQPAPEPAQRDQA
ncbi:MAG TPA: ATPase [Chloroflexota bacterium]|nr:ATPase [Chloroflexota bacterium]